MLRSCQRWQPLWRQAAASVPGSAAANIHTSHVVQAVQLKMPSLSPTMTEGTIVKWLKVIKIFMDGTKKYIYKYVCHIATL